MALTAQQIRTMLKPMHDFAPAILRCAEIVEAAEQAEQRIVTHTDTCCTVEATLASLADQHQQARDEMTTMQQRVDDTRRATQAEIERLQIALQIVKDQLSASQRDFEETQRRQQAALDALTVATQIQEQHLTERQQALTQFMSQFPAVK